MKLSLIGSVYLYLILLNQVKFIRNSYKILQSLKKYEIYS
jgi:hypothetical protein